MATDKVIDLNGFSRACADCRLQDLCLPIGIAREDIDRLDRIVNRSRPLPAGKALFRQGDRFSALYAIRSGSIKSIRLDETGHEHIHAFHLPGEILGLDAIGEGVCPSSAIALETASVCEIPFDQLETLSRSIEGLQHQLLRIMSRELASEDHFSRTLAHRSAEQRLAGFILDLAKRHGCRGYSHTEFTLSMPRADIANYLGLAVETLSRLFTRFQHDGLIEVKRKTLRVLQPDALAETAGLAPAARQPRSPQSL